MRNVCAVCNEPIFLRTCPLCLTDKIESWLEREKLSLAKDFRTEVRQFLDKVKRYNTLRCDRCRIETETAVCPMCFNQRIFAWLTKKDKALAADFVRAFKTDLQDTKELYA